MGSTDAARADADGRRGPSRLGDDERGRGGGNAGHAVMLGDPVAMIALRLGLRGDRTDTRDGVRGFFILADIHEIEEAQLSSGEMGRRHDVNAHLGGREDCVLRILDGGGHLEGL